MTTAIGSERNSASWTAATDAPASPLPASGTAQRTTSDELVLAAKAVLRETDARSESSHPMRYTCPWKQLTRLRKALAHL
jgi:hypothetical protein